MRMHRLPDRILTAAPDRHRPADARPDRPGLWAVGLALAVGLSSQAPAAANPLDTIAARFADPPAAGRMLKIIHGWPDAASAQAELISRLKSQGFGGAVCNVSFERYLEDDGKWAAFERAVRSAKPAGLSLWLYDERGYPSANAGGLVLREHPAWEARGLLIADAAVSGAPLTLEGPPGQLRLAAAFPEDAEGVRLEGRIDLADRVSGRTLRWTPPDGGRWRVLFLTEDRLYEGTHAEMNLAEKMPYPNLLLAEPTRRFLEVTHQRYADHLGADLGRWFEATFMDEPSLMSCFIRPMPYRVLPWSATLAGEFERRRGYALEPWLPALVAEAGPQTRRARHDFWRTIGELVSENFFGQIQTWCRAHGLPSGGHLLMEESLAAHVPLYGDFFACARGLDAPGIDCLTSVPGEVPWHIARLLASVAELEGRPLVMSETSDHGQVWRAPGDTRPPRVVTESEIRGTLHRLLVAGVNRITSYYSFKDLADDALLRLNRHLGRCVDLLAGSQPTAEIALVYPVQSAWTRFVPSRHWARDAAAVAEIEEVWRTAAEGLFNDRRDFTMVDARALIEAQVTDGALVHGPLRWRVVVLPLVDTLPLAAWRQLDQLVQRGGTVIALGRRPAHSDQEFPSASVEALGRALFGTPSAAPHLEPRPAGGTGVFLPLGSEGLLPLVLRGLLDPNLQVDPDRSPIRVTQRRHGDRQLLFVINDSAHPWTGRLTMPATGAGRCWDPARGTVEPFTAEPAIPLTLDGFAARFYEFAAPAPRGPSGGTARALPTFEVKPLAPMEPAEAHGEFVRAALSRDPDVRPGDPPRWKADATLTRGGVDTYLFLRFTPPRPLDLGAADCVVVDTWVPPGQRTPNRLLVIVQEQGGGDFLAETARSLGTAGHSQVFIPLNRFVPAGWSRDPDGAMDWRRVGEIRVGWGGYFGAEGERVAFSAAAPTWGQVRRPTRE